MADETKDNNGAANSAASATPEERALGAGSNAPTNQLTTEQIFEVMRKQQEQIDAQNKQITQLLASKTATDIRTDITQKIPEIPKDAVKVGSKSYLWKVARFTWRGSTYTAEEASTDKELLKKIVAIIGQKILVEQV